ncbi:hypothetical protein KQI65_16530 [bacterium]|nr:hypothetical protein [bacterium]
MRHAFFFLVLIAFSLQSVEAQDSTSIDLRGLAAFRVGDDDVWRSKYIDEQEDWNFIPVPGAWEQHGFPLVDGFAWYRVRFRIPDSMRDDSLLLVMSGVDDADETFLNGVLVGKTGSFPPDARSELRSLRVYPLPRFIREEFNLLAVRVYDRGDRGGITGNIFRIVRAQDMHRVLDEIVDAPPLTPPHFISNGVMVSAIDSDSGRVLWTHPHAYGRFNADLATERILTRLSLTMDADGVTRAWLPDSFSYYGATDICHAQGSLGSEVFWYHPINAAERILVVAVRQRPEDEREAGLIFVMDRPYWRYEEREEEGADSRMTYHLLAYNSCCTELVDRDMEAFLERGAEAYGLDAEIARRTRRLSTMRYLPESLRPAEKRVYRRAVSTLLATQVREPGLAEGQILTALQPPTRTATHAADHLLAAQALAGAGMADAAEHALDFIAAAGHERYKLFDVFGTQHGVGFPYLVSPAAYFGTGEEWQWQNADDAVLRYDGMARYLIAFDALREERKRGAIIDGQQFSDSSFLAPHWTRLSSLVADVLMYRLDDAGLLAQDESPWGAGLSDLPSPWTTLLAARSLRLASGYASVMHDDLKRFLYAQAAQRAEDAVASLAADILAQDQADALSPVQRRFFHPFIIDAITMGLFPRGSKEAALALDIVERGFAVEDMPLYYSAEPGGDWFARQARPQIALRLARAYAANGNLPRAEALFAEVTRQADAHDGMLPELIEPVSGNYYGGLPHTPTAADYILTAEFLIMKRLEAR